MWNSIVDKEPPIGQPLFVFIRTNYEMRCPGKYDFGQVTEACYNGETWLFREKKFENYKPLFWIEYPPVVNILKR